MKSKRLAIKYPLVSAAREPGAFRPTQRHLQEANHFFNKCKTQLSFLAFDTKGLEKAGKKPEVLLLGRSNVGKSSLVTALMYPLGKDKNLTNKKDFARTSANAGFTKSLNFYNCGDKLHIVDTPGYGFRSTPDQGNLVMKYLEEQRTLRRIYILIDSKLGITESDKQTMEMINQSGVSWQISLTKLDQFITKPVNYVKLFSYPKLEEEKKSLDGISEQDAQTINDTVYKTLEQVQLMVGQGYGSLMEEVIGTSSNQTLNYLGVGDLRASILQACSFKGFD